MNHAVHGGSTAASAALLVLLVVLPAVLLGIYLAMARRELKRATWSVWRTTSYAVGTLLIVAAISSPLSEWAARDLRGHMVQHLLLGMFGPLALVLGAPGTLLLRNIPVAVARRVVAFLATRSVRFFIHPITAALLDIGGMYVLYLTPFYALSMTEPLVYVFLHLHFVISGYLFTWSIAGPDPAPHRAGMTMRLTVLFLATAAHATLGKLMYGYGHPRGTIADRGELQAAAQWMYYGGDLAELFLIIAFFAMWFRRRNILPVAFSDPRQVLYKNSLIVRLENEEIKGWRRSLGRWWR